MISADTLLSSLQSTSPMGLAASAGQSLGIGVSFNEELRL